MSLKATFSNVITFTVINEYCRGSAVQIANVFRPTSHVFFEGCSETQLLRHLSSHLFRSWYFRKRISYDGHLFLANV